jgi:hydroxyacylglutathione hydrolase
MDARIKSGHDDSSEDLEHSMPTLDVAQFIIRTDNFAVLLHDPKSGRTVAIDAPEADPIIAVLKERGWTLSDIFVTHKHFDHIEGIPALQTAYDCTVTGPEASAAETGMYDHTMKDGDMLEWAGRKVQVIETPGHTLDHVSLYFPEERLVFVGDTLFSLGCGRVMQGEHARMWDSLLAIRALPEDTELYCGHEYTLANAKFALSVDPENPALKARAAEVQKLVEAGRPALPTTIGAEKAANPFLRADDPVLMRAVGMAGARPAEVFKEIRTRKDNFRG